MRKTSILTARGLIIVSTLLLLIGSVVLPAGVHAAQTESADKRPRIALVLGGGGARGAAHVGVLKVLEELRIPVDFVVGTSMGSIVGGLYAAGMNPDQIEQEMLSLDWNDLFRDYPPRKDRSFRRKRDDDLYTFKARIGLRAGEVRIPLAYIRGQKFDLEINRLLLPVVGVKDFDQLPVPYRAVAADLETGKEVVLERGSLAKAIRASMAVPAAFDPVEIDGRLLVDGGIANNVPVSVAREMGAEVFIVVDVGSGLYSHKEIKTGLDVSAQLTNFLFSLNSEAQLQSLDEHDVLIKPELGDIGSGSFGRIPEAIPTGEIAARKELMSLQRYSLSPQQYAAYRTQQRQQQTGPPIIDFIRIDNQSQLADAVIADRISARPGQPLDTEQLKQDIGTIYGLEIFQSVRYDVVQENGQTGLVITATEKYWGPGYLQFGLASSSDFDGDSKARLGVVYTLTGINALNGEWRTGAQLGDEPGIFTEVHQPLDPLSRYFASAKLGYWTDNVNVFDAAGNKLARYDVRYYGAELGFGREFGTWGEGRLGFRRDTGTAAIDIGTPAPDIDVDRGEWFARLSIDKLDNRYFPRAGRLGTVEYLTARENYGASGDYDQIKVNYLQPVSWGQNTILGGLSFTTTEDDNAPLESLPELGGLFHLSGLQEDQLTGQHAGLVNLVYMRSLRDVGFYQVFKSYAGLSLEVGNVWQTSEAISFDDTITAGSLFVGFDTPIGPLYLAYGQSDTRERAVYIYLGPRFTF